LTVIALETRQSRRAADIQTVSEDFEGGGTSPFGAALQTYQQPKSDQTNPGRGWKFIPRFLGCFKGSKR
jgi:hypothetical protein